jgi:CRISPR-associated endonuclease Cas1
MFNVKDIESRNVIIVNTIEQKNFKMQLGNIVIIDELTSEVVTKLNVTKVFAIFIIGGYTITSHVIESCIKNGINLVLLKYNLRPVARFCGNSEANYLLRKRQYHNQNSLELAKHILYNKCENQIDLITSLRNKSELQHGIITKTRLLLADIDKVTDLSTLMGIEGNIAKLYYKAYFDYPEWKGRKPRTKMDQFNVILDIGYTLLFNFIECFAHLFGFDVYFGVCHQTWFKRKSLICDFIEPFRVIVDYIVCKSWNLKQFKADDFDLIGDKYVLKTKKSKDYVKILVDEITQYKVEIFKYIQEYYRCFMAQKSSAEYPKFGYIDITK